MGSIPGLNIHTRLLRLSMSNQFPLNTLSHNHHPILVGFTHRHIILHIVILKLRYHMSYMLKLHLSLPVLSYIRWINNPVHSAC